jgi:O-antigen/teichoic acid export membrane protein
MGAAILVLPLVIRLLPPAELGLWYVFLSVGFLVTLLDAGFGPTATRMISYLWAGASTLSPAGVATPPADSAKTNYPLMADLLATMRWYYRSASVAVALLLAGPGGVWIWQKTATLSNAASIRGAWVFFCLGTAINMAGAIWPAGLIGINGVRQSQQILASALLANYVVVVAGLLVGWGLWAMVAGQIAQGLLIRMLGKMAFISHVGPELIHHQGHRTPALIKTLWPMSWRTAAIGLGAYMILQANTLICSNYLSLSQTASYGLTLQLVTALSGVSAIWVSVKAPLLNGLRVSGDTAQMAQIFVSRLRLTVATYVLGAVILYAAGPALVKVIGSKTHLLPHPQLLMLLLFIFLEMHHSQFAGLVLSENKNPFVVPALASGVAVVAVSLALTPRLGVWGMLVAFGGVQLAFNNWWTVLRGIRGLDISPRRFVQMFLGFI